MNDFSSVAGELKGGLLQVISENPSSSAKELFYKLKKRGVPGSYQGVHKALVQLEKNKVISKEGHEYSVNSSWVSSVKNWLSEIKSTKQSLQVGAGSSIEKDAFTAGKEAAMKALNQTNSEENIQLVLVFASSAYDGKYTEMLKGVRSITGDAPLAGCTTMGEICGRKLNGSVCVTAIVAPKEKFRAKICAITDVFSKPTLTSAKEIIDTSKGTDFCILFFPGYSRKFELKSCAPEILSALSKEKQKTKFFGCLSGDDWKFEGPELFADGKTFDDKIVTVSVNSSFPWTTGLEHGYLPASGELVLRVKNQVVTHIGKQSRNGTVYSAAVKEYAKLVDLTENYLKDAITKNAIKEIVGQSKLLPLKENGSYSLGYPIAIRDSGILFNNYFADRSKVRLMRTTPNLISRRLQKSVEAALVKGKIIYPKLLLVFQCASFEAVCSRATFELGFVKKKGVLRNLVLFGPYCNAEIGENAEKISQCNGSLSFLILGTC